MLDQDHVHKHSFARRALLNALLQLEQSRMQESTRKVEHAEENKGGLGTKEATEAWVPVKV